MAGLEVMPLTPLSIKACSLPEVISERRMKSNQTDWPNFSSSSSFDIRVTSEIVFISLVLISSFPRYSGRYYNPAQPEMMKTIYYFYSLQI
jgi:hypothetical protein